MYKLKQMKVNPKTKNQIEGYCKDLSKYIGDLQLSTTKGKKIVGNHFVKMLQHKVKKIFERPTQVQKTAHLKVSIDNMKNIISAPVYPQQVTFTDYGLRYDFLQHY